MKNHACPRIIFMDKPFCAFSQIYAIYLIQRLLLCTRRARKQVLKIKKREGRHVRQRSKSSSDFARVKTDKGETRDFARLVFLFASSQASWSIVVYPTDERRNFISIARAGLSRLFASVNYFRTYQGIHLVVVRLIVAFWQACESVFPTFLVTKLIVSR